MFKKMRPEKKIVNFTKNFWASDGLTGENLTRVAIVTAKV